MFNPEADVMESIRAKGEKREAKFADLLPVRKVFGLKPQPLP